MLSYLCHPRTFWVVIKLVKTVNFKVGEGYWKGHSFLIHYGCFFFFPLLSKLKPEGRKLQLKHPRNKSKLQRRESPGKLPPPDAVRCVSTSHLRRECSRREVGGLTWERSLSQSLSPRGRWQAPDDGLGKGLECL